MATKVKKILQLKEKLTASCYVLKLAEAWTCGKVCTRVQTEVAGENVQHPGKSCHRGIAGKMSYIEGLVQNYCNFLYKMR